MLELIVPVVTAIIGIIGTLLAIKYKHKLIQTRLEEDVLCPVGECIIEADSYTSHNACGIMDAFGTWKKEDFLKFLDTIESKYGIKQAMIYEWQYVPSSWL